MPTVLEPKIDFHCHVLDPVRFPYQAGTPYSPAGQEIAPLDHLDRMMDLHGVRHALIVGTNSGYGTDSSPVLDALARGRGRYKGVIVAAHDIETADLAALKAKGVLGVAFNAPFHGAAFYAQSGDLLRRLCDLDMILQLQVNDDQLPDLLPLVARSGIRLVVDHCGRPSPSRGLDQHGFQALLALGSAGNVSVKLSGLSQFSEQRHPYRDTQPFIRALVDAFTLDRCVWGSDWPFLRAKERIDYGPLLSLVETMFPDPADRCKLLWDTPRRLFGFGD